MVHLTVAGVLGSIKSGIIPILWIRKLALQEAGLGSLALAHGPGPSWPFLSEPPRHPAAWSGADSAAWLAFPCPGPSQVS